MRLTLLLGSGVSLESIPGSGVQQITQSILEEGWARDTGYGTFSPCSSSTQDVLRIQLCLRELQKQVKRRLSGHHKRLVQPTYEDLFYCVDQLHERSERGIVNPLLEDFTAQFDAQAAEFVFPARTEISYNIRELYSDAANFIRCVVWRKLISGNPGKDLDFLPKLVSHPQVEQAGFLTLNHDLLIEKCLTAAGIVVRDGFGPPDGKLHWLQEETPEPRGREVVRLCKLHGSVNWFETSSSGARRTFRAPEALSRVDWVDGKGLQPNFQYPPRILAGSYNKLSRYYEEPFSYMFRYWKIILNTANTLLVSGYGFGDLAVNLSIIDWMDADPARRIIVFHKSPNDLIANARHWHGIIRDAWKRENRLVFCENWIGSLTADKILDQVAQSST